jgi:hypothetical protein
VNAHIRDLIGKSPLPVVTPEIAAALCDTHLESWFKQAREDREALAVYVAHRVLQEGASEHVEQIAEEVVRLQVASVYLAAEISERNAARKAEADSIAAIRAQLTGEAVR